MPVGLVHIHIDGMIIELLDDVDDEVEVEIMLLIIDDEVEVDDIADINEYLYYVI